MEDRVLITGATGFTGSHIANHFAAAGVPLTCLVRKQSDLSALPLDKINLIKGDITDIDSLINATAGHSLVIHNAGLVTDWGKRSEFFRINVEGTGNVMKACLEAGIRDIILTGTNAVYGEEDNKNVKDEKSPCLSHYPYFLDRFFPCGLNHYRDTKAEAVSKAVLFAKTHGLNLTVLEPVWVYGEREKHTGFYEYLKSVKQGMFAAPGSRKNRFHVIYAGDLAEAYYCAYKKRLQGINRIIIGNRHSENMHRIWQLFCREADLTKPVNLPKWVVYPVGFILELMYTIAGSAKAPLLTRGRVNMFFDNIEYSTKNAKDLLGFECRTALEQGVRKTVKWYRENAWISTNP